MPRKKVGTDNFNSKLALVMKSGKAVLGKKDQPISKGYKQAMKSLRLGTVKMIVLSSNCPTLRKTEIDYYTFLAKTEIYHFAGNNKELGKTN